MDKILILFDDLGKECRHQELWDPDENKCLFSGSGSSLCEHEDMVFLMELGIEYGKKGVTSISIHHIGIPCNESMDEFIEEYLREWKEVTGQVDNSVRQPCIIEYSLQSEQVCPKCGKTVSTCQPYTITCTNISYEGNTSIA